MVVSIMIDLLLAVVDILNYNFLRANNASRNTALVVVANSHNIVLI